MFKKSQKYLCLTQIESITMVDYPKDDIEGVYYKVKFRDLLTEVEYEYLREHNLSVTSHSIIFRRNKNSITPVDKIPINKVDKLCLTFFKNHKYPELDTLFVKDLY